MKLLRKIKLKHRLLLIFLLVAIVPLLICNSLFLGVYKHNSQEKLRHSTNQMLCSLQQTSRTEIEKYIYLCGSISVNKEIQDKLIQQSGSHTPIRPEDISVVKQTVGQELNRHISPPYLKNIRILNTHGDELYDPGYCHLSPAQEQEVIVRCDAAAPMDYWQFCRTNTNLNMLVFVRRINSAYNYTDHLGYIIMFVDESLFSDAIFGGLNLGTDSSLTLLSKDGSVLSTTAAYEPGSRLDDTALIDKISSLSLSSKRAVSFDYNSANGKKMVSCIRLPHIDGLLMAEIPFSYIYNEYQQMYPLILGAMLVLLIGSVGLIALLYGSVMQPVHQMEAFCDSFSSGNLSSRINDSASDEIGLLSQNINSMADKITTLMDHQKLEQKRKRKLELQMLQYQINPHFLFNSLNTLKWIAIINKIPVVSNGITALANLLKSTITKSEEQIPLREELQNLDCYFELQKLQYAGSFSVKYELDDTLLDCRLPRFLLQPLAENSILHGIGSVPITITIRCCREKDDLVIELEDTGKGFQEPSSNIKSKKMTGIGISNVDERLKLNFGPSYGLTIHSAPGQGTLCRIRIPYSLSQTGKETLTVSEPKETLSTGE